MPTLAKGVYKTTLPIAYLILVLVACVQTTANWWLVAPFGAPAVWWLGTQLNKKLWPQSTRSSMTGFLCVAVFLGVLAWLNQQTAHLAPDPRWLRGFFFLQETFLWGVVTFLFCRSLLPGQTPVCTWIATLVHERMTEPVIRYSRAVTVFWAVALVTLWAVALGLFIFAPVSWWALYSTLLAPVMIATLFIAEYMVRPLFLAPQDRPNLLQMWKNLRDVDWTRVGRSS